MQPKAIRELSIVEIEKNLRDTREEYLKLRLTQQTSQIEKTHRFKELRRSIARLHTILTEKTPSDLTPITAASKKIVRPKVSQSVSSSLEHHEAKK